MPGTTLRCELTPRQRQYLHVLQYYGAVLPIITQEGDNTLFTQPAPLPPQERTVPLYVPLPRGVCSILMRSSMRRTQGEGLEAVELLALHIQRRCIDFDRFHFQWSARFLGSPSEDALLIPLPLERGRGLPRWRGFSTNFIQEWACWLAQASCFEYMSELPAHDAYFRCIKRRLGEALGEDSLGSLRAVYWRFQQMGALLASLQAGKPIPRNGGAKGRFYREQKRNNRL